MQGIELLVQVQAMLPMQRLFCVPKNLVAKVPDSVSFDEAAFTTLGAIVLQGVRCRQRLKLESMLQLSD